METPLNDTGSISQELIESTKVDSQPLDSNAEAEESKSKDQNDQGEDDSKSLAEEVEENKSEDLKERNEDETKPSLETLELQEDTETSMSHPSSSWDKATSDFKDDLSSFLTSEQSTTPIFSSLTSDNTTIEDLKTETWMESHLVTPELKCELEEEIPFSLWKNKPAEWKDEELSFSVPARKPSFHNCCCCSTTERLIKHSPLHVPKAPFHKNVVWTRQGPRFRGHETSSPQKVLKQNLSKDVKRKKDHKAFPKAHMHRTSSLKRSNRRSKALYNLYTTFCDEGEHFNPCLLHGAKGLSRACTIFSAIRRGRININYLLITLHTLGILLTRAQMFQALKFIPVDAHGNLDFYDFLDVARDTLLYIDTEAFQNVQWVFRTIKKDMIAIEELEPILVCLGISLSPNIIQQTLECTRITRSGRLNISEFLSAVRGLLSCHMSEYGILESGSSQDFATIDDFEIEWRRNILLNKAITLGYAHLIGLHEPYEEITVDKLQKNANKSQKSVGLRKPKKASSACSMEEKDKKDQGIDWPKIRPKFGYTSQDTLFPLSSSLPLRGDKLIAGLPKSRWPSRKAPILPDLYLVTQASLSTETTQQKKKKKKKKRLSFQDNLPTRHDPDEDNQETDYKTAESEDKELSEDLSFQQALQNIFDVIQMLAEDSIKSHDLCSTLNKMGVSMSDTEFQEMLLEADVAKDGTVNFNSFTSAMGKTHLFNEFASLKYIIQALDRIEGDKMVLHDLPSFIRNMGMHLNENDFQETLEQVFVDGNGKIIVKDFIEILTHSPQFKELSVLKDIIQAVSNIEENKVSLKDLRITLRKMGIHLYPHEYEDLIQKIPADREGKVDIGQVIEKISKMQCFSEIKVLNNTIKIINQFKDKTLNVSEVESCLNNIGVHLTKSELMQATETLSASADETVDVKELVSAVKGTRRLQHYAAVLDSILALKFIKEHQAGQLKPATESLQTVDLPLANQVIGQALKSANVTEAGQAKFNDFLRMLTKNQQFKTSAALEDGFDILTKMKNGRMGFKELQVLMQSFNINLPTEEVSEALAFCNIDDDNTVNLKEFIRGVIYTNTFVIRPELQLICLVLSKLKEDPFDLQALQSSLNTMELSRAGELLKEVMNIAKVDSNGKVNLEEFIRVLTVIPEIPEATVLKDTFDAISNIRDHNVNVNELAKTLTDMGINLTPEEIQSLCDSVTVTGDGEVNFNDIMREIIGTESFEEFHALQNAFNTIHKIVKEDIKKEDLLDALENLGRHLSPDELQAVLASASIDESGKLHGMEFLKILSSAPNFSDFRALQDATKVVENIKEEKMSVKQLEDTLENMEVHLPSSAFNQIVQAIQTDENGKIDFKEFLLAMGETKDFTEMEALQHAITIAGTVHGDWLHVNELQDTLNKLGLHLTEENIQEILHDIHVDADGTINLQDFLMTLPKMQYFRDSLAIHSAVEAFSKIKDGTIDPGELESIVDSLGIQLDTTEFQNALKSAAIHETGKVSFKDFLINVTASERFSESSLYDIYGILCRMDRDKVEVSQLKDVLATIGITLTKEQMKEALKNMTVDSDGKVNLKEFMKMLSCTQRYTTLVDMEEAVKTLKSIKQDKITFEQLDSIMRAMGLQLSQDEIQKAQKYVTTNADGTFSVKDFMFGLTKALGFPEAERKTAPVNNLNSILENLGISLTEEEMNKALKQVTVDGDKGDIVAVEDVDSLLSNIGIHLTKEQLQEALKNVTVDENGKVKINELIESVVKTQRQSQAEKDEIHVHNLDNVLTNMGIYLTDDEIKEALNSATPNEDGKVNLDDFMRGVKNVKLILSAEGQVVETGELSSSLTRMGLSLTEEETQEALKPITLDANGKVDLKNVLENVMLMQRPSKLERDRIDIQDLNRILTSAGVHLTEVQFQEALASTTVDIEGKVNLGEFMKSVRAVQLYPQSEEERIAPLEEKEEEQEVDFGHEEKKNSVEEEKVAAAQEEEEEISTEKEKTAAQEEKVAVEELGSILANEGISLSEEELQEVLTNAEVNADGTVNLSNFFKVVREIQGSPPAAKRNGGLEEPKRMKTAPEIPQIIVNGWTKEEKVDIDSLDAVLEEMGIHLTNRQLYEALKYAPIDDDGMVGREAFERGVLAILRNEQMDLSIQDERVDVNTLCSILADTGLHLSEEEIEEVLKRTTLNKDMTVDLKDFLCAVDDLLSIQEKELGVSELDAILGNMGTCLTPEEQQDMLKMANLDRDETVNLNDFVHICSDGLAFSNIEGRYSNKMPDAKMFKLPRMMEKSYLQTPNRIFSSVTFSEMAKSKAVKNLSKPQLEAFRTAYDTFRKDLDGTIDLTALETTALSLGIILTEEEVLDELMYADIDGDGKVNFTDFLTMITDTRRFIQAVAPKKDDMETVDARGILFFELLSKLVETSRLPRKATLNIVSYYREKFLDFTGKRAWQPESKSAKQGEHHSGKARVPRTKSSPISAFAGAAHICVMNEKELQSYVENLQAKIGPSDSPYAQVPIFPLIPNRDVLVKGKPKKDLQKLEAQRRMEPISSFEDHFFHKRRWIKQKPKPAKASRPSLVLSPQLSQKRLTVDHLDEIRQEVKKVTGSYQKAMALHERDRSLKLWRRLHGGEIGLETGNPSFYQTFSTYSWSWNVCQDLVSPRELQEYDKKLYQGVIRPSTPVDKLTCTSGKQKGSKK